MKDLLAQIWSMLAARLYGPLAFRFGIQPCVGAILGIRAGLRDARSGRPAFGWAVLSGSEHRPSFLREAWRDLAILFVAAAVIDLIYEITVYRWIYPGQALLIAFVLAVPSYWKARGLTNRIARRTGTQPNSTLPSVGDAGNDV
jgi:hypothetical protein